jgi:hypothetical protein
MKLFRREILRYSIERMLVKTYAFDLELLSIAARKGAKVAEAPVVIRFGDKFGALKISTVISMAMDSLAVFYRLKILGYYDKVESLKPLEAEKNVSVVIACPGWSNLLAEFGLSREEYEDYKAGKSLPRVTAKRLRRIDRIKPYSLTPTLLLSGDRLLQRSELKNPEHSKILSLLIGLIPTTLGTFFTVSVILTTKDTLTAASVFEGILKLSALPIIGFKGYSSGYSYVKCEKTLWIETKTRLLEQFKNLASY